MPTNLRDFSLLFLLLTVLVWPAPKLALAQDTPVEIIEIGRVLQVEGDVERKGVGDLAPTRLIPGDAVFLYDTLETHVRSLAKIEFLDESQLSIQEASKIQLTRFVYSPTESKLAGLFNLVRGEMFAVMGSMLARNAENSFEIETKNAVAGVRGTEFSVKTNDFTTEIYSINHSTYIETRGGDFATLEPKTFLAISPEGKLGSPTSFDGEKIRKRFLSRTTPWRRPNHFERLAPRRIYLASGRPLPSPWIRTWQPGKFPNEMPRWKLTPEERRQRFQNRQEKRGQRFEQRHEKREHRRGRRR